MNKLLLISITLLTTLLIGCNGKNIRFEDDLVKQICVKQWDTDGDGEISFEEAAAVTAIGGFHNTNITSFDEFKYFTGVTVIYSFGTFKNCKSLTSITLPVSITTVEGNPFYGCTSLPVIDNIRYADTCATECIDRNIETATIKEGTRFLCGEIFQDCSSLKSVAIPDSVISIGASAFESCYNLEKIVIPNGVTSIGYGTFNKCYDLKSVNLPNSITSIEESAFESCSSLENIVIPNGVTSINDSAFSRCYKLKSVNLPNSITSIEKFAFSLCGNLTDITLHDNLVSIGSYAFRGCKTLMTITIPQSVSSIGGFAFYDCTNLTQIYCKATTPPKGGFAMFTRDDDSPKTKGATMPIPLNCKIYVPAHSVNMYKSAEYWDYNTASIAGYKFE